MFLRNIELRIYYVNYISDFHKWLVKSNLNMVFKECQWNNVYFGQLAHSQDFK